jgi:hypothetical protein
MLTHCSFIIKQDGGKLKQSLIKINTGLYVNVTERGVAHDWAKVQQ